MGLKTDPLGYFLRQFSVFIGDLMKKRQFNSSLFLFLFCFAPVVYSADYINTIGMAFNTIKAGSFYMGGCRAKYPCPSKEGIDYKANINETPQRKVTLSDDFQLGVYEVTLGQYKRYVSSTGGEGSVAVNFIKLNANGNSSPVVGVSWQDAQDFISWLNKKESTDRYRLPTEAQWEYAAKAGSGSYHASRNFTTNSNAYAWYAKNSNNKLHEVGLKKPNHWGLYDMQGNVWEWTADWYSKTSYQRSPSLNPKGVKIGINRVIRGGSWFNGADKIRSSARHKAKPTDHNNLIGFRVVRML